MLPECRPALAAYEVCETQWRTGFGCVTGFDYAACIATLTLYLPRWKASAPAGDPIHAMEVPDLLDDLRTIEEALLTAWAEVAEQKRTASPNP